MATKDKYAESTVSSDGTAHHPTVPEFAGTAGEDVTGFVRRLQSAAFSRGLRSHDDWIADYASTLLSGKAFIWWSLLGVEVQTNWCRLREALLTQFLAARATTPSPRPAAAMPPSPASGNEESSQESTAPSLTAVTARSIAVTAWASSEYHSAQGIRIYKPWKEGIQEIRNKKCKDGLFEWEIGDNLLDSTDPVGISDTAPLAAANSFGSGIKEEIIVYYVARNNHLRSVKLNDRMKWVRDSLDVHLNGVCTALHATWHVDTDLNSVWTICYTIAAKVYIRQERRNLGKEKLHSFDLRTKSPRTTDNAEYRDLGFSYSFTTPTPLKPFPDSLGHNHCVAGIDCDPHPEMRFFLTEQNTINQYTFDHISKKSSGPLSLVPHGQVPSGSPITVAVWHTKLPTLFVFFLNSDNSIGYWRYAYAAPIEQREGIHSVQV
ncbi:hypothetical protein FRB93_001084 [Tulasnella sp. JGI-2019a]|nr:hypothetical protein FRB93_001084 [Tulasnella sp. JGI-2019a]